MQDVKIIFGYVVFWQDVETLKQSLRMAGMLADQINIVYGRFKDFPLPYQDKPQCLFNLPKKYKVIEADNIYCQPEQRDQYLTGAKENDIIVVCDADWVYGPDLITLKTTFDELKSDNTWDSVFCCMQKPDGTFDNGIICIYRYRQNMCHNNGQLLSIDGQAVASPDYKVKKLSPEQLVITHDKNWHEMYRIAQKVYWMKVSDKRRNHGSKKNHAK